MNIEKDWGEEWGAGLRLGCASTYSLSIWILPWFML